MCSSFIVCLVQKFHKPYQISCQSQRLRNSQSPRTLVNKDSDISSHLRPSITCPWFCFWPLNAWNISPSHLVLALFWYGINIAKKAFLSFHLVAGPPYFCPSHLFLSPTRTFCCLAGLQLIESCCLSTALISLSLYMILEK